jgi:hypothetical protein
LSLSRKLLTVFSAFLLEYFCLSFEMFRFRASRNDGLTESKLEVDEPGLLCKHTFPKGIIDLTARP